MPSSKLILATIVQCEEAGEVGDIEVLENRAIHVDGGSGRILWVRPKGEVNLEEYSDVVEVNPPGFICPGLIDVHYHAPQDSYKGTGLDMPVMKWLETYTFPAETMMKDTTNALQHYSRVVETTLHNGTTTCVYFATIHTDSSLKLAETCVEKGQRAFVGKVTMDRNSPETYVEKTPVAAARDFLEKFPKSDIVKPILTPRFLPTCEVETLKGLAVLRDETPGGVMVTTHISESADQVKFCDSLEGRDLGILRDVGLLKDSVLAHCIHLNDEELVMVRDEGGAVAHCPLSNCFFGHSVFPVAHAMRLGVPIGLATDVAGGYDPSMLSAIRHTVTSSLLLSHGVTNYLHTPGSTHTPCDKNVISSAEAFYLATLGSASCLNLQSHLGTVTEGKLFDALQVDPTQAPYRVHVEQNDTPLEVFEKWLNLGDDRCLTRVWVNGVEVVAK